MYQSRSFCFFFGVSVGAAVALLYAPRAGSRTRALVAAKAKQGQQFVKEQGEELRDQVVGQAERRKEALFRAAEGIKATVDAGRKVFTG